MWTWSHVLYGTFCWGSWRMQVFLRNGNPLGWLRNALYSKGRSIRYFWLDRSNHKATKSTGTFIKEGYLAVKVKTLPKTPSISYRSTFSCTEKLVRVGWTGRVSYSFSEDGNEICSKSRAIDRFRDSKTRRYLSSGFIKVILITYWNLFRSFVWKG